jgi:hypothetical protein
MFGKRTRHSRYFRIRFMSRKRLAKFLAEGGYEIPIPYDVDCKNPCRHCNRDFICYQKWLKEKE